MRDKTGARKRALWGYVYLHCVIDDRSRYAYVEQHPDQRGRTAAAVLERAIGNFSELGMRPPEAVMSDNALAYRKSRAFKAVIERQGARHILIPPYTPRWNGKVERFIHPSFATTTGAGPTAHSETGRRSAVFTTSVGRTSSG